MTQLMIERRKREMIAERYRQFESAYSNFKGSRHSPQKSINSGNGASFSFNQTTYDAGAHVAPWTPADN